MNKSRGTVLKQKESAQLVKKLSKYKTIALVEMNGFPSPNFQEIKKIFRDQAEFVYTKKVVIYNALKGTNEKLAENMNSMEMPVVMLSNLDPFEIVRTAMENRAYTKIKAGQPAPEDIVLPTGPTAFAPGPMLTQFSSLGVKTKNEGGKISIVSETTVVKKGESVSGKIASLLSSMEITPKELFLSVIYALNGGLIISREILYKPNEEYIKDIKKTFSGALALSMERGIINAYSIKPLIKKAYIGVKFLSVNRSIVSKSTINDLVSKASIQNGALVRLIGGH